MKLKNNITIFVIINILFLIAYVKINKNTNDKIVSLNKQIATIQQKEILIFDITQKITQLETLIYRSGIFSLNQTVLNYNKMQIHKQILQIKNLLHLLQNGGIYIIDKKANFSQNKEVSKKLIITKSKSSVEISDILSKLNIILDWNEDLYRKINRRNNSFNKKITLNLKREMKLFPSIFNRMSENINRYLQYTEHKLYQTIYKRDLLVKNYLFSQIFLFILYVIINAILLFVTFRDIKNIYDELSYRLYHDNLTGLKNRISLEKNVNNYKTLIAIDIEGFSDFNEIYGFEIGNEYLIEFSNLLKSITNQDVYRIGSDEFAVGLYNIDKNFANKIYNEIRNSQITIKSVNLSLVNTDIKIGVALNNNLLSNVIFALKLSKQKNIPIYIVKKEDIEQEKLKIKHSMYWTNKLKESIKNDKIIPFFQPITDSNKNIIKYEALMRIEDEGKFLPPFYLDIALKANLYSQMSKIMFEKSISYNVPISFNLSYSDFENEEMKNFIIEILKTKKFDITFEILETEMIEDYEILFDFIGKLKQYNAKIAIDDFGSGYSNFKRIIEIMPNFIKIDGSLIKNIENDRQSLNIVKSIVFFAKSENIKTVAEFIENEKIFNICKEIGIDYFQGYYLSKPLHPNNLT